MRRLRALWMRLRGVFGVAGAAGGFDAELENHLAEHTQDGVAKGLSETEARRQALLRLVGMSIAPKVSARSIMALACRWRSVSYVWSTLPLSWPRTMPASFHAMFPASRRPAFRPCPIQGGDR